MRSDRADRAGGSATDGYVAARGAAHRRRLVQAVALGGGVTGAVLAPTIAWGCAAVVAALIAVWWARPDTDPERWLRGAAGEEATAALLERLSTRKWVVFHDRAVPGTTANLDHVAIGPTGVWMIDTKTYRAPLRAGWRSVRAGRHAVDTAPAAWEASVVAERLDIDVRPVLAVHGEGLPRRGRRVGGVPVLPASRLLVRLGRRRGSARLGRAEVEALGEEFDRLFPPAARRRGRSDRPGGPGTQGRRGRPDRSGVLGTQGRRVTPGLRAPGAGAADPDAPAVTARPSGRLGS